jgi:NAD(P)-dependent dehydrogenase (short-subunit alcohol dehydrogenase family)
MNVSSRTSVLHGHLRASAAHSLSAASKGVCVIVGAGDATGSALARRFAADGYQVALVRRNGAQLAGLVSQLGAGQSRAFSSDARDEEQVQALFKQVEEEMGPIQVAIHNIGANVRFNLADTTSRVFRKVWELTSFSAFLVGREAAKYMVPRKQGTVIFTGATASLRGSPGFAAFAAGCVCVHARACSSRSAGAGCMASARWHRAWRASSARRASTWRTW